VGQTQLKSTKIASFLGLVHLAYNPSYSAYFFSRNSIFLSQKSVNSVFQPAYNSSRTAPSGPFYLAHTHIKIQTLKTLINN
jgi:hypothetical protein